MRSTHGGEHRSRVKGGPGLEGRGGRGRRTDLVRRRTRGLLAAGLAILGLAALAPGAGAAEGEAVTIPGSPLAVSLGPLGQCQSGYPNRGGNWYNPSSLAGDCGFFLAFPAQEGGKFGGQPKPLEGLTFGFTGSAGPSLTSAYTPISQSGVEGAGTAASPYSQTTRFSANNPAEPEEKLAEVTETTTYVNGEPQFISTFNVKNVTKPAAKIYFRAMYVGDMFLLGSDFGTGVFLGGPPRFVGGQNPESGAPGGLVAAAGPPWRAFQEGRRNDAGSENPGRCSGASPTDARLWNIARSTVQATAPFNHKVDPATIGN